MMGKTKEKQMRKFLTELWNFINTLAAAITRNGREVSPVDEDNNK